MRRPLIAPENDYSALNHGGEIVPTLRVSVVIPVYNRVELLKRTLAGLVAQTYPSDLMQVVVSDDGSDEDVPAAVAESRDSLDVRVLRRDHDGYGAGQARNLGAMSSADADVYVFFDADSVPDRDAVSRHAAWHHLASDLVVIGSRHHVDLSELAPDEISAGGPTLRDLAFGADDVDWHNQRSEDFRDILHRRTASLRTGDEAFRSLVSSNFSVDAKAFERAGGFSADFRRWGGEDTELGWRLWNDGAFFIDASSAAMYHQTQEDSGPAGWRDEQRKLNEGLIRSKIPHRFYRTEGGVINEAPKVTVIIHGSRAGRLDDLADQLLRQRLDDLEVIVTGFGESANPFIERRTADPRFSSAASTEDAVKASKGEFVALLHGEAAPDHRLLSRSVAAIERRPRLGYVTAAYGIQYQDSTVVFRTDVDIDHMDNQWDSGLPIFGMTRRRDLMKSLKTGASVNEAWQWVVDNLDHVSHNAPLVWLPSENRDQAPEGFGPPTSTRSEAMSDLKKGGMRAAKAPMRVAKAILTGSNYRYVANPGRPEPNQVNSPTVNYIGWSGHQNLGDEAMLLATRQLLPWAEVSPGMPSAGMLMLGGGTLINRGYLRKLKAHDSPRVERVIFGTGVANPEYWTEPKEKPEEWAAFVESCAMVGVRGPISESVLDGWGVRSPITVIGDPALSLQPTGGIESVDGRVVVSPAFTRGLLWGESDQAVFSAFARLIKTLRSEGRDVWVLSAFPGDDRHIIEMMRQADAPDLPYLAAHDDPQPALDLLATADLVVAERLHAAVLAAAAGSLPLMVEYRPKLRDFAASVALDDLVIKTDSVGGDALTSLARDALEGRTSLLAVMNQQVDLLRRKQVEAADRLHTFF